MPLIGDHVDVERKPKLGGGGPGKIPHRRGYGGGGDDGDNDNSGFPSRRQRLRRYRVAMVLCIISVSTLFVGLTSAYLWRLSMGPYDPAQRRFISDWYPFHLPYEQLWINTSILLLSSLTLELARRRMMRDSEFYELGVIPPHGGRHVPWLGITLLLGFAFLAGQVLVWKGLNAQGLFLDSHPSSFFFFMLTGTHALHLMGGLIGLIFAASGNWIKRRFESRQIALEVTAWYWHFMGILWLYVFGLLHFAHGG